jgi:hypothetical protein
MPSPPKSIVFAELTECRSARFWQTNAQRGYLFKKGRGRKTFVRPWTQRLFELSVADLKIRYYAESAE